VTGEIKFMKLESDQEITEDYKNTIAQNLRLASNTVPLENSVYAFSGQSSQDPNFLLAMLRHEVIHDILFLYIVSDKKHLGIYGFFLKPCSDRFYLVF